MKIHIVQKGDTLWKIAKKYGVNFEELKKMNTQLSNPDMIMPGMKIKVPGTGGSIKKEAPIGGMPETKIKMGSKKEMPIKEHPFAKEKPITLPVVEAPKEVPVKEAPIVAPPKKELPKVEVPKKEIPKEIPKVTAPTVEIPKEIPKKPYIPKMPKPIMPEIDINNYYMMNMANLAVQQPVQQPIMKPVQQPIMKPVQQPIMKPVQQPIMKPVQQPIMKPVQQPIMKPVQQPTPQLPPKPVNILPQVKPLLEESSVLVDDELSVYTQQGGFYQPMYPYQQQMPMHQMPMHQMPMHQMPMHQMPMQQMPMHQMPVHQMPKHQMPMHQMPMHQMPKHQMPMHQTPHYGMAGVESHGYDESSPFMSMHQMPAPVMGVESMSQQQLPLQPTYTAPAMQPSFEYPQMPCPPMPCPPYPTHLIPVSPVMPGSGLCGPIPMPYGHMPFGYPHMGMMPHVHGVMEESPGMAQMPLMPSEHQMPLMPTQSQMPLKPTADCGCDGGAPQMGHFAGFDPGYAAGSFPGAYGMRTAPLYSAPYGQQMDFAQSPYMNPYGYGPMGGQAFEMPQGYEESSEFDG